MTHGTEPDKSQIMPRHTLTLEEGLNLPLVSSRSPATASVVSALEGFAQGVVDRLEDLADWIDSSRWLQGAAARRLVKAGLDFLFGAAAMLAAIAMGAGLETIGLRQALAIAGGTGLLTVAADSLSGSYRSIWRYTSLPEMSSIAVTNLVVLSALLFASAAGLIHLTAPTALLGCLLAFFLSAGTRALRRWQAAGVKRRRHSDPLLMPLKAVRRVLIVGAGGHGLSIARELADAPGVSVVGFLDDDTAKIGALLNGLPVLGPLASFMTVADESQVSEVIVAMPSAATEPLRRFIREAEEVGYRVRTVRGAAKFILGHDVHRPGTATIDELLDGTSLKWRERPDSGRKQRVLVTGGAGFIGSHLTRLLLQRGYRVRILDRFDYGSAGIDKIKDHPRLEILTGDICNSRDLSQAMRNVDGVLALAAIVGDPACSLDPEETINLNYTATKILTEVSNFYGVRRLVFASSCSVYGASSNALLTEQSRLNPVSLYARTRVLSENIIFDRHGDVEPVVLRLSTVFGLSPRMRFDLVVNTLTARAVIDKKIAIFGGNQWRPNVHCRDVARAFMMALEAPREAVAGEIFNVGGDHLNHRISDLGDMVAQIVGDVQVEHQQEVPDPRDYRVGFGKIRRVLGFEPECTVADGIQEVAAAVRATPALQRHQDPRFHNVQALKAFVVPKLRHLEPSEAAAAPQLAQA
jgi:nucleoside-diphosphate-sugar epimerase